jgi:hypothetical protein
LSVVSGSRSKRWKCIKRTEKDTALAADKEVSEVRLGAEFARSGEGIRKKPGLKALEAGFKPLSGRATGINNKNW